MSMGFAEGADGKELVPRSPGESIAEILGMSVIAIAALAALASFQFSGNGAAGRTIAWAEAAGVVTLDHIGWGLGSCIPTLLGFYAIVIGGQLTAPADAEWRARRMLGFVAELMVAAFTPALLLAVLACVASPPLLGSMFVIAPVSAVMFFLAIQLGGFILFGRQERLAAAARSRDWARMRLGVLTLRSRRRVWIVALVNTTVATVAGTATAIAITFATGQQTRAWAFAPVYALIAGFIVCVSIYAQWSLRTARDRSTGAAGWGMGSVAYALFLLLAGVLLTSGPAHRPAGAGVIAALVVVFASTVWPRKALTRFMLNWSLHGASAALGARTVARVHERAVREIADLTSDNPTPAIPPLVSRLRAALEALRTGGPSMSSTS